ncbi:MAG: hypothetical protein A4S12_01565 [Proteobacteria bacterium SG_bin5]|nr:hypothetical protein [Sphingomonas sp.]OQW41352.1 MAG: hypothetical protein A4S12_01565 [Proteobacteria bacterium SG_bin5]
MARVPALAILTAFTALSAPAAVVFGQKPAAVPAPVPPPPYALVADLVRTSPSVVDAVIRSAARLKPQESPGLAPGFVRFDVTADVMAQIKGRESLPPRINYLVDVPLDARGRPPKLKALRVLLFAVPVPGKPDQLQLIGKRGQQGWTPAFDARIREIARALVAADAPPEITGIGNVFTVPGSLPGERETQIFLTTKDGRPVSLSVIRRPGEAARWAVALSEIVDEAAAPPARDSLLWYRLACFLPPALPERSVQTLDPANALGAREDYGFVLAQLGRCER